MEFSLEHIARQSEVNAVATILSTLAYLKKQQLSGKDWVSFLGTTFGASWEPFREEGPQKALELIALDMRSIGATLLSIVNDPENQKVEAVFGGWPDPALLSAFDLSVQEAFAFMEIFGFLANHIGLGYQAQLELDDTRLGKVPSSPTDKTVTIEQWQIRIKVWRQ